MSFMALEIAVNGELLYTVGAEDWRMVWAHVMGHRITPDSFTPEMIPPGKEVPDEDSVGINFMASVAVPGEETVFSTDSPDSIGEQFMTESYKGRKLSVGDVVTIKVIETDAADEPNGPKPDPRFPGQTVVLPDPDVE